MNWGAHKADVRIAAKNSVTVRAALRASINAKAIWAAYQDTHPYASDNITQDRARARAWAMLHVKIDNEPIEAALKKVYTDGFLLGLDSSKEAIGQAAKEHKRAKTKAIKDELLGMIPNDGSDYVDWKNWKAGNRAAALQYRPTGAFKKILDNAGIVSKAIAKVGYDRIGTALADSVAAGFSPARAAKVITEKIGDPARALTIAITEQNRAMSLAAMQNYQEFGVEKVEWSGAMPCDICAPNEGQVVETGQAFNSGDTEPPVHPNCRCAVLPVINEEFYKEPSATDGLDLLPSEDGEAVPAATPEAAFEESDYNKYLTGRELKTLGREQANHLGKLSDEDRQALRTYKGIDYMKINGYLREGEGVFKLGQDPIENARILEIWNNRIDRIQNTIEATQPLKESFITFRGITGKFADEVWNSAPGSVFQDKGFASTTTSKVTAKEFGGKTQLQIINPVGSKGLAIEEIIDVSSALKEYEWLLPAGSKFEVVSKIEATEQTQYIRTIKVKVVK